MYMELQLSYLLWLQNIRTITNNLLTPFFLSITTFGEHLILIITCAITYWCINKKLGTLLFLNCTISLMFNQLLKSIACIYRPWMLEPAIKPIAEALPYAGGYSFPSGHSALAVSCWGTIGLWNKDNKRLLIILILLCLSVAFSRNYLGVHTPQDVIIGLLSSLCILFILNYIFNQYIKEKHGYLLITASITLISLIIAVYCYLKSYPVDFDQAGQILISPDKSKWSGITKLGLVLGSCWGIYLENRFIKFDIKSYTSREKILKGIYGTLSLILILLTKPLWKQYCSPQTTEICLTLLISFYITFIYPYFYEKHLEKQKNTPA